MDTITDDEWRAQKFSTEVLASARQQEAQGFIASFQQLVAALEVSGPDGILESAVLLPRTQYERLEQLVKAAPAQKFHRRRHRHG